MKILIVSERFFPSVGGVQTVTRLLAEALVGLAHRVTVVTREPGPDEDVRGVRLLRRPWAIRLFSQYRRADAIIVQGLPMRLGWPLLRRPDGWAIHHIQPVACEGRLSGCLRAKLAARVRHAAVSRALARELPWFAQAVLPNPYEDEVFRNDESVARNRDVIFVGRLITEKGVSVLMRALAILQRGGRSVTATIVGDGPERRGLEEMVKSTKLEQSVVFAGQITGSVLAQLLNHHRLMVVPSVYHEPFGVVALEGIACGCVVIGSDAGGLPEAIGPCGTTFPLGDAPSLAGKIQHTLASPEKMNSLRAGARSHLAVHRPSVVARKYLELFCTPGSAGVSPASFLLMKP